MESDSALQKQINLGKDYLKTRDYGRAEETFLSILKKHKLADVYNALGLLHADKGEFNFAEVSFKKALEINPNYMEAALNLSVIYNNLGLSQQSKAIYQKLKKYGAKSRGAMDSMLMAKIANMHAEIGDLYHSVGEYKASIDEYEKAVNLCPDFIDVQTKLAICLRESGEKAKALQLFKKLEKKASKYAPFWIAYGVTFYSQNKSKEAARAWKKALNLEPRNRTARAYQSLIV